MTVIDNGGAIAIKGFNYQKAAIIHVMIKNFDKDNFKVIPESREDFEVHLEQDTYFIQVKGIKKLSLGKLMSRPKGKPSIIEKNLSSGDENIIRKIFLWDLIEGTKNELVSKTGNLIPLKYCLSDEQRLEVIKKLKLNDEQINRLKNQYIYITPFPNDLSLALTVLKGEMVDEDLLVTNERAKVVLGTLCLEIDQRSEIEVTNDGDIKRKEIDSAFLKRIFMRVRQKELFETVLNNLSINTLMKERVKKQKYRIPLLNQSLKMKLKNEVDFSNVLKMNDEDAINYIKNSLINIEPNIDMETAIALSIDCFLEWGEEYIC